MKIIKEESVYEDGVNFHCVYFDDDTYVCLTDDEYYNLLKLIENENQSDLNDFINKSSTKNSSNTSSNDMSNIGMFFAIVIFIVVIWIFNKIYQWIPIILSTPIFVIGMIPLIDGIINHKKFHFIYALIYSIGGFIGYLLAFCCLVFMIYWSNFFFGPYSVNKVMEESGFNNTAAISLILTIIGSFFYGAYYEFFESK